MYSWCAKLVKDIVATDTVYICFCYLVFFFCVLRIQLIDCVVHVHHKLVSDLVQQKPVLREFRQIGYVLVVGVEEVGVDSHHFPALLQILFLLGHIGPHCGLETVFQLFDVFQVFQTVLEEVDYVVQVEVRKLQEHLSLLVCQLYEILDVYLL